MKYKNLLRDYGFIAIAVAGLFAGQNNIAAASDEKVYPASACHPSYNSDTARFSYGSGAKVTNTTTVSGYITCPIVRDDVLEDWDSLTIRVDDRHPNQDISCTLSVMDNGSATSYTRTRTTSGTGVQSLYFNNTCPGWGTGCIGNVVFSRTPYAVRCSIPGNGSNASNSSLLYYVFAE